MDEPDVEFWTAAIDRVFAAAPGRSSGGETLDEVRRVLLPDVRRRVERASGEDVGWLVSALRQPGLQLGVAVFFERLGWIPDALFEPMIEAALGQSARADEGKARAFIAACRTTVGLRRINEALLDWLERGSQTQRVGAARALRFALPNDGGLDSLGDVGERRRRLMLERFVRTDDVELRLALVDQLDLDRVDGARGSGVLETEARGIARGLKA